MSDSFDLYIHIGPPKTATTSLQNYFYNLEEPDFYYGGITPSRPKVDELICRAIYRSLLGFSSINQEDILATINPNNKNTIISNESFLLHFPNYSWQKKIKNLFKVLGGFDPKIIIVLRHPVEAIRSYYQELYFRLNKSNINSINDFAKSNYCKIFNYLELDAVLKDVGFTNIIYLDFKKLIDQGYCLNDILNINSKKRISLNKKNKSLREKGKFIAKSPTLKQYMFYCISSTYPEKIPISQAGKLLKRLYWSIPDLKINKDTVIDTKIDASIIDKMNKSYEKMIKKAI